MIEEPLLVLAYSGRTRNTLIIGVLGAAVILVAGECFSSRIEFEGPMAALTTPLRAVLVDRAVAEATLFFVATFAIAVKRFLADRKRLLGY